MRNNKELLTHFLARIIDEVSQGSSDNYAAMALRRFLRDLTPEYPFIKYIRLATLSANPEEIMIEEGINTVEPSLIAEFFRKMVTTSFPDLLKHLIVRKMNPDLLEDLNKLGVLKKYVWI